MAAACNHPAALPCVQSVDYRGVNVRGPKCDLPFRPGTKFLLGVTKRRDPKKKQVRIAIDGPADGLKGELWIVDTHSDQLVSRWSAQLNKNYAVTLSADHRVFCKVWPEECPVCKDEAAQQETDHREELKALRSQLKQSEDDASEQRLQAENSQKALQSRIRQLEREAAESERKLAAALQENDARTAKNTQLASTIQSLEAKLGERKKAVKEAADRETALVEQRAVFEKELDALKSKLSKEQVRSSSLQRQVGDHEKAARESKKEATERERKLAAVQREQKKQLEAEVAALKLVVKKNAGVAEELAAASENLERVEKAKAACTEQNEQLAAALEQQEAASEAAAAEKAAMENELEALLSRIFELEQPAEGPSTK
ncbi:hypothetical protein M3Y99_01309900 [Aphelenchoides fujianensis]|nr:hypothetical protein M3Y99_01309900 [Aphelenchoides fujianensis]